MPEETPMDTPVADKPTLPTTQVGEYPLVATDLASRWTATTSGTVSAATEKEGAGLEYTLTGAGSTLRLTSLFEPISPIAGGTVTVTGNLRVASGMGLVVGLAAVGTNPFASPVNGVFARVAEGGSNVFLVSAKASSEDTDDGGALTAGEGNHEFKLVVVSHEGSGIMGAILWVDGVRVAELNETNDFPAVDMRLVVGVKGAGTATIYGAKVDSLAGGR